MARPTKYNSDVARDICQRLMDGESLRTICSSDGMPTRATVFNWLHSNQEFFDQYARAREVQAEVIADEILDIADDGSNDYMTITKKNGDEYEVLNKEAVMRSSLRVDARKWVVSKLLPKKYGDLKQVQHSGTVTLEQIVAGSDE